MIAVIGVGGAGGNMADLATQQGYQTGAINYSRRDLDTLEYTDNKLHIPGSEGVGKNRKVAIELFQKNYHMALEFIEENFTQSKVIIITFATGGGSGSGISPILLDILIQTFPDKTFMAMPILPDTSESITNQINSIQVFEELSSIDVAIIAIDNEKVKTLFGNIGKSEMFQYVNENAINSLSAIYSYTQKQSKNGNFDEKDLMAVLNTKGICLIGETEIKHADDSLNLSGDIVQRKVWSSWENGIYANIEYDKVVRAGIVYDGNETILKQINIQSIFNKFDTGMPIAVYEGYYSELDGKLLTIISGLSFPKQRLGQIENIINKNEQKIATIIEDNYQYKAKTPNLFNKARSGNKTTANRKENAVSIFSKYKR